MFRKMIALFLIIAMLIPLSSAVAADEPSESRSMEEIIDEYYQRAFEARTQRDTEAASTWSRRSGKTLEEETVDTLTAAGYEAYNVTADNYDTLEAELKTDFATMGLDPEGSYIVVLGGEAPAATEGASTYDVSPLPEEDQAPDDGSNTVFEYTYDGTTYRMRYVTIIPTLENGIEEVFYPIQPDMFWSNTFQEIVSTSLITLAETSIQEATETVMPLGLILSILEDWYTDENFHEIEAGTITVMADCAWTAHLIQIWTTSTNTWDTAQISERVRSKAYLTRLLVDPVTGETDRTMSDAYACTHYSPMFFDTPQRIIEAIEHYDRVNPAIAPDTIRWIEFYFRSATGEIFWTSAGDPLFIIERAYTIPHFLYE